MFGNKVLNKALGLVLGCLVFGVGAASLQEGLGYVVGECPLCVIVLSCVTRVSVFGVRVSCDWKRGVKKAFGLVLGCLVFGVGAVSLQ